MTLCILAGLAGCAKPHAPPTTTDHPATNAIPAAAIEAKELLLRATVPSPDVEDALGLIAQYADESTRLVRSETAPDGSAHVSMFIQYPTLGIAVTIANGQFAVASPIPDEATSNKALDDTSQ